MRLGVPEAVPSDIDDARTTIKTLRQWAREQKKAADREMELIADIKRSGSALDAARTRARSAQRIAEEYNSIADKLHEAVLYREEQDAKHQM